jgi:hypothetical protein
MSIAVDGLARVPSSNWSVGGFLARSLTQSVWLYQWCDDNDKSACGILANSIRGLT